MDKLNPCAYKEIIELYEYCQKIGVNAVLVDFYDGYSIRFPSGADFVQHKYSYGAKDGYVEPAIYCSLDFTAVSLKNAKNLVKLHKEKLNRRASDD